MKISKTVVLMAGVVTVFLGAAPAFAHHSFAMFDFQKTVVRQGTIKSFEWTNPHSWIVMVVKNAAGADEDWAVECSTPNTLARQGWTRSTLKPGDKASLKMHPLKDGKNGGSLVEATIDGKVLAATVIY